MANNSTIRKWQLRRRLENAVAETNSYLERNPEANANAALHANLSRGIQKHFFLNRNKQKEFPVEASFYKPIQQPNDWLYNRITGEYVWDSDVSNATQALKGFDYLGPSLKDVKNHFEDNNPIASFFKNPKMGDNRNPWPGEIMSHENTVFEEVRNFGVENGVPGSKMAYDILDDLAVFITSFDLLNPKGEPLHLDGSISTRGSQSHIDSGINALMIMMPIPKFSIRGFNVVQSNKFLKGTWYNKLSPNKKGKVLKTINFLIKNNITPKKILKQTKSNLEKIKY